MLVTSGGDDQMIQDEPDIEGAHKSMFDYMDQCSITMAHINADIDAISREVKQEVVEIQNLVSAALPSSSTLDTHMLSRTTWHPP